MIFVLMLLYPIFFIVTVSLIVGGWLRACVKKEEEQLKAIRQKPSGQDRTPLRKRTLGSQMKQAAWATLSGIVWVALAVVLTLVVAVLSQWRYFWTILSGSGS